MTLKTLLAATFACAVSAAAYAEEWGYGEENGPRNWAEMKPEFAACGEGKAQSPINIRNAQPSKLAPIKFDYKPAPLRDTNCDGPPITRSGDEYGVSSVPLGGNEVSISADTRSGNVFDAVCPSASFTVTCSE